ncbi:MAG: group II intron reverse transcriptase/maturase [Spirochaetes bacterium]|nr:group II intron reverse transcriptase/maturase [Spirochaetota bacterium]
MTTPKETRLIEKMMDQKNMVSACSKVVRNKGAAGIDGMTVNELNPFLKKNWPKIKEHLLNGTYKPKMVKGVEIPKATGGTRQLGIPTVMDRVIQQALHQVLSPIFDPRFSNSSYGFRPGKSAHQAVEKAREYQAKGNRRVVDMDLAKFFDEVNHDILMARIARKVKDKKILRLIRSFLQSGVMGQGLEEQRIKGTPQGGPLSPLLSNITLDDLDKELERRGHSFCRYADDCKIYVRSRKAGERVLESITNFVEKKLKLKVNQKKSKVTRPWKSKFLGYSFTFEKSPRIKVSKESIKRFKMKLKQAIRKGRGMNLKKFIEDPLNIILRGWINYYRLSEVKNSTEELDGWIRRRLRLILWRQWKRPWTRRKRLMNAGLTEERAVMSAFNRRGPWWNSGASHMNQAFPKKFFDSCGLISLFDKLCDFWKEISGTAVYGTVRTVV